MSLKSAIARKNISEIRKIANEHPTVDIAELFEGLSQAERMIFFRLLNTSFQSELFSAIDSNFQEQLLKSFSNTELKSIIDDLYTDEIADLIEEVPVDISKRILLMTSNERRITVNKILRYSEDEVGSLMSVDIVTLKQIMTVKDAIQYIKVNKNDARLAHYFFITNNKNNLQGFIAIEDLLFLPHSKKLKSFMKPVAYVYTTTDKEKAANIFADQDMSVLPVLNIRKEIMGMITSDDVIDIIIDEANEDIEKMHGIENDGDQTYLKTPSYQIFKSRVFLLMLLMISATLSQIVLDLFLSLSKTSLAAPLITTAMVAIFPFISWAAGNAGSQSSTTIIRSLVLGEIKTMDYLKVLFKELKISTIMGLSLGIVNFIRLLIYYLAKDDFTTDYIILSAVASFALFIVIILAKLVGSSLPLLAKKIKIDPTVMAAPLLTTLIDALSTTIFFGVSIGIMLLVL
ncbi:magnesium transporter [Candidatus Mycoplasma mahonii]|uniref:magnesium transporter n=1 Tax=Candidatus Mycoplasma mahonii TaxID=3004105 RepID=UPI0026ED9278|nr:magnesium transporter [Candidatus Mycoplasma mahonii]WKX02515.1 magnesium transporter [Candidatus Mycoplasma mahonii]